MNIETVLQELRERFADDPLNTTISEHDVEEWCRTTALNRDDFLSQIAVALARAFHRNEMSFDVCNAAIGGLSGFALNRPAMPPNFWEVFLAFDSGEVSDDPSVDPVAEFCRPSIAKIVAGLA